MATRARGDVLQSPWVSRFDDYLGRAITITVNFNNTTRAISGGSVTRDVGCLWSKILVGVGVDGIPDHSGRIFDVPVGTNTIPKNVFNGMQLDTVEDIQALQITAGL
jgi:hypothetical protein